ncbi:MAG TPA: glycosyltransferase family 9 protein [Acidimicrobiales bacterium]|nr:glycosyltransferase family 9 protein [Acidimicrobiales bacterium]
MSSEPTPGRPRIAVLRALPGIGDLLCAVPALRALRAAHPAAHVTLLGLPSASWFVARYPDLVDDLLPVDGVAGLPEVEPDPVRALAFYRRAQERRFDLGLQVHGSGTTTNPLLTMLGARHQVSAHREGDWVPPGVSVVYPEDRPEIDRLLAVTSAAGCPPVGRHVDLPVDDAEDAEAVHLLARAGVGDRPFACVHPGASRPERRWSAPCFAIAADHLARKGLPVVVTGSTGERHLTRSVLARMAAPSGPATGPGAVDLAGRTSVGVLGALQRRSCLVTTNDTGASHVAAAVKTPSVVVFGSRETRRWAPLDAERHLQVTGPGRSGWSGWPEPADVTAAIDVQLARFGTGGSR